MEITLCSGAGKAGKVIIPRLAFRGHQISSDDNARATVSYI